MTFVKQLCFFAIATFYRGYCSSDQLQNQDEQIHIQSTTPSPHDDYVDSYTHPDPNRVTMAFDDRIRTRTTAAVRNSAAARPLSRPASSNMHGSSQSSSFHRQVTNGHHVELGQHIYNPSAFVDTNDFGWAWQPPDFGVNFAAQVQARGTAAGPHAHPRQRVQDRTMSSEVIREASTSGQHVAMSREVQLEARNDIYLPIVNDARSSWQDKKSEAFRKLVDSNVRSEMQIHGLQHEDSMQFDYYVKYSDGNIGANNDFADRYPLNIPRHQIKTITWNHGDANKGMIALGRMDLDNNNDDNNKDIIIRDVRDRFRFVSRIQAFILLIADKLIIFDGWSLFGTRVLYRSNQDEPLIQSVPNDRNVMTFGRYETVHLRIKPNIGNEYVDIVLNPQTGARSRISQLQPTAQPSHSNSNRD